MLHGMKKLCFGFWLLGMLCAAGADTVTEAKAAMRRAAEYFHGKVAAHGG